MEKFILQTGVRADGEKGYSLQNPQKLSKSQQRAPATKKDIVSLQESLIWPPAFMRDVNIQQMEKHRQALMEVLDNPNMHPTENF